MTFEKWKAIVDFEIAGELNGLTSDDLPDMLYRDEYDAGTDPYVMAVLAIENYEVP